MNAAKDGSKLSDPLNWIRQPSTVPASDVAMFSGIRASFEIINGSWCRFGTSVGTGASSYIPFPYTQPSVPVPQSHMVRNGPCSNAGNAFLFG